MGDWSAWLAQGDEPGELEILRRNADKGLPCGSQKFIGKLEQLTENSNKRDACATLQRRTVSWRKRSRLMPSVTCRDDSVAPEILRMSSSSSSGLLTVLPTNWSLQSG